ncbi:hypothetical protein HanPI659440_Chr02g0091421 [Helianthus annuus]|nr:hypothetical protein HanPI659440_Chr02g0091421 [Helianthus annuus]
MLVILGSSSTFSSTSCGSSTTLSTGNKRASFASMAFLRQLSSYFSLTLDKLSGSLKRNGSSGSKT